MSKQRKINVAKALAVQLHATEEAIETALAEALVYINGGQRGLQVRLAPADALAVLKAKAAPLIA